MRIILTTLISLLSISLSASVRVTNLTIEGRKDQPMGLDVLHPCFGWQIVTDEDIHDVHQTQYHILVASSDALLAQNKGDLWDTTVKSDASQWIRYEGKPLQPNSRYCWKIQIEYTFSKGRGEAASSSHWTTGLLNDSHWFGSFVGWNHANPWDREDIHSRLSARYFRLPVSIDKKVKRATLHICGLGLYEAFLDGNKVGTAVLTPAPTDYDKSVIYNTYDITPYLATQGCHCLAATVSNGRFYTMKQHNREHKIRNYGYPCLRANIIVEYEDGSSMTFFTSDKTTKVNCDGAIRSANEYDGEVYDANKPIGSDSTWSLPEYNDSVWNYAERVKPLGALVGNLTPPMRVVDILHVKNLVNVDNRLILDYGQNISGWIRVNLASLHLQKGDTLKVRYAEKLQGKDSLYTANLRTAEQTDTYIANGCDTVRWAPRFVTHGGRYAEISILTADGKGRCLDKVETVAEVVSDEMDRIGLFECSKGILDTLVNNACWGIIDNYKGMPIDCPQRDERMPWLGDRTIGCWGESYLLNNDALYYKWIKDIAESQRADGCLPDVAPAFWNYYTDDVTWPAVIITAADMLYRQFGDKRAIEQYYPNMYRWLMHIWNDRRNAQSGLIEFADKYADWCVTPESPEIIHSQDSTRTTDGTLIASCYMYHLTDVMREFAKLIPPTMDNARKGMSQQVLAADTIMFNNMRNELHEAINRKFLYIKENTNAVRLYGVKGMPEHILYPDSVYYANNSVTANLLPLAFGIVPQKYEKTITSQVLAKLLLNPANGHLCCGVIGVQWLLTELSKRGRVDVAYLLASRTDYPSWGYMARHGATTIWELWNGDTANPAMNSGNHVMLLGDLLPFIFRELGGISYAEAGYKKIRLAPRWELEELSHASASYDSPYGKITSNWSKSLTHLTWEIDIPCNTTAEVVLPSGIKVVGSGHYIINDSIPSAITPCAQNNVGVPELSVRGKVGSEASFLFETASFPSCHASTITELANGDLLAAYFGGSYESCKDVCIYTQRKRLVKRDEKKGNIYEDGWSAPQLVVDGVLSDTLRKACYNPVLFQIPGGDVILHYKIGKDVRDWTGYQMRSTDGGYTWTGQRDSIPFSSVHHEGELEGETPDSLLGAIKNQPVFLPRGFKCKNGTILTHDRIIAPTSKETAPASKTKPGQWRCYMEISEDSARTWWITKQVPQDNKRFRTIQPTLLIHPDGCLQLLARTGSPKSVDRKDDALVATSWSDDGGVTWSEMQFVEDLPNDNSGIDAVTLKDGTFAVIYTPFGCVDYRKSTDCNRNKPLRNPLWIATSRDGIHWAPLLQLETSPVSQYSYPTMILGSDGTLHCIYTWRRERIKYQRIKLWF